ncbi:MAG TPA: phytanoyl-CoA dioxygenase family protein [Mycobacteriales bacterium]|nr:phytanoyl-CoA dioxygenase family protein [Mycobacteriales bacterium]
MRIQTTAAEKQDGHLTTAHREEALEALRRDGYVVLGGVIDPAVLDRMKPKLDEDTATLLARGEWGGAGRVPGHLQQSMPRSGAHIYRDIVVNPLVIDVTAALLGPGVHNHFYNGNTNMPGSKMQPLHRDHDHLWPGHVHPTASVVVNVSPVDVDEENGATEIWPGTHLLPEPIGTGHVTPEQEKARRAEVPPVRACSSKGDAVLRDMRMWHRGMPNNGIEGRHMIGMVHSVGFYHAGTAIPVNADAVHLFEHDVLSTPVEVVPDDYDYLSEFVRP